MKVGSSYSLKTEYTRHPVWEAVIVIGTVFLSYFLFWIFLGPGEMFGADRGHLFLVGARAPDLKTCFSLGMTDRYRPLAIFVEGILTGIATTKGIQGWYFIVVLGGILLGINACLFYAITKKITRSWKVGALAVFLWLGSNATLSVSWTVLFSVFYAAPLFLLFFMLYGYLCYRSTNNWLWMIPILVGGILGPWFREIGVLGSVIIFFSEVMYFFKKRSFFIVVAFLLLLHGLFSTAIPSFFHLYPGGVRSVFSGPEIKANFPLTILNWWRAGRVVNEIPPLLWLLAIAGAARFLYHFLKKLNGAGSFKENKQPAILSILFVVFSCISLSLLFLHTNTPEASGPRLRPELILILYVFVFSMLSIARIGFLPAFWVLPQFLALIKQPNNFEPHLVFIVPALCIMVSVFLIDFVSACAKTGGSKMPQWIRILIFSVMALGVADQSHNVFCCFRLNKNIVSESQSAADWMKANIAARSVIFVNSFPAFEMLHRTGWIYDARWISPVGPITHDPSQRSICRYKDQVEYIRKAFEEKREVYYLILTSKNFEGPYYLPKEDMETIKQWTIRLPQCFLDPLRYLVQKPIYMNIYAPFQWRASVEEFDRKKNAWGWDLEFTFSHFDRKQISRILATEQVEPALIGGSISPRLVKDGYKNTNYNIIEFEGTFYALWRGEGPFVLKKVKKKSYGTPVFIAHSAVEIEAMLDNALASGKLGQPTDTYANGDVPQLIVNGYKKTNYNIIFFRGRYYGLFRGEGAFIIEKINAHAYGSPVFAANTLPELEGMLDKAYANEKTEIKRETVVENTPNLLWNNIPQLVVDGYGDTHYNIIYYGGKYYGLSRSEGEFLIEKVMEGKYRKRVFIADSLEQIKKMLDKKTTRKLYFW